MNRMRSRVADLPVGRKLALGFGVVGLLLALVVSSMVVTIRRLERDTSSITETATPRIELADDVRTAASDLRATQLVYTLDRGASRPAFSDASGAFERALGAFQATTAAESALPGASEPRSMPSTRAGLIVIFSSICIQVRWPGSTKCVMQSGRKVSRPTMPLGV